LARPVTRAFCRAAAQVRRQRVQGCRRDAGVGGSLSRSKAASVAGCRPAGSGIPWRSLSVRARAKARAAALEGPNGEAVIRFGAGERHAALAHPEAVMGSCGPLMRRLAANSRIADGGLRIRAEQVVLERQQHRGPVEPATRTEWPRRRPPSLRRARPAARAARRCGARGPASRGLKSSISARRVGDTTAPVTSATGLFAVPCLRESGADARLHLGPGRRCAVESGLPQAVRIVQAQDVGGGPQGGVPL